MILVKFFFWVLVIYLSLFVFVRFILPIITRYAFRYVIKKAQQDMDRQSRIYQQYAEGHSPFEDNIYINDDTRVSIKRGQKNEDSKKSGLDPDMIEDVNYEDID
ncbi:MAG: hypothetical protein AAF570_00510 [Bacteroidota bacterium]